MSGTVSHDSYYRHATLDLDPALLAFVKCHVSSHLRWDVLRALVTEPGRWFEPVELARTLARPPAAIRAALDDLSDEGVTERSYSAGGTGYRLAPDDPTTALVLRLIDAATRSQELRRIIVARILGGAHGASGPALAPLKYVATSGS